MTQQELLEKLDQCLSFQGYHLELIRNWQRGVVVVPDTEIVIYCSFFTYDHLLNSASAFLSGKKKIRGFRGAGIDEHFMIALKNALETFTEAEKVTTCKYTIDQQMFDYLKESVSKHDIKMNLKEGTVCESMHFIELRVNLNGSYRQIFYIQKSRFDFEGLEQEIEWIPQDLIAMESENAKEIIQYIQLFANYVRLYKRKLIREEVQRVLSDG